MTLSTQEPKAEKFCTSTSASLTSGVITTVVAAASRFAANDESAGHTEPGAHFAGLVKEAQISGSTDTSIEPAKGEEDAARYARRMARLVGKRIWQARNDAGLSQTEFADLMGYKNSTQPSLWELGKRPVPQRELIRAARVLGVSLDYLLGETSEPVKDPYEGARTALFRGMRHALDKTAYVMLGGLEKHIELVGPGAVHIRGLVDKGARLSDALRAFIGANAEAFQDMRRGSPLVLAAEEFDTVWIEASGRLKVADQREIDLARELARLSEGDPELDEES